MTDIFGQALLDYQSGNYTEDIRTFSSLNEEDTIPLPYLFRNFDKMPSLEQKALQLAKGKILDIGCGAGNHSLYLQREGFPVTGLDTSLGAIEVCKKRGIKTSVHSSILDYTNAKYDTLLLLMNGIGLAGKLTDLGLFLNHLKSLLSPKGQILLDSSDIIYMFDQDQDGGVWIPNTGKYYGEVQFYIEYKGKKSLPFHWLYLDFNTLQNACSDNDLNCELVSEGEHYDYLAKLSIRS
ncbi:MAG: methyltransferase domain-containing protein [Flavobacteriaceae bacterium]